jgi:hypothetical protein
MSSAPKQILDLVERFEKNIESCKTDCPGVSMDMIRKVLKDLKAKKKITCLGRGQNAEWKKMGKTIN